MFDDLNGSKSLTLFWHKNFPRQRSDFLKYCGAKFLQAGSVAWPLQDGNDIETKQLLNYDNHSGLKSILKMFIKKLTRYAW